MARGATADACAAWYDARSRSMALSGDRDAAAIAVGRPPSRWFEMEGHDPLVLIVATTCLHNRLGAGFLRLCARRRRSDTASGTE